MKGYWNKPNAARNLELEEVDTLFERGFFGRNHPLVLQRTIWWFISLHFGFRARDESNKLNWGDKKIVKDSESLEEVVWMTEHGTKTRTGEKKQGSHRKFPPRMTATGTTRCPVSFYKFFEARCPVSMKQPGSPLYLAIKLEIGSPKTKSGIYQVLRERTM